MPNPTLSNLTQPGLVHHEGHTLKDGFKFGRQKAGVDGGGKMYTAAVPSGPGTMNRPLQ